MAPLITGLIVATFAAVIGGFAFFFRSLNTQMMELRLEVREIKTQVSPLWAKVQAQIASDLHHPHPRYIEMDGLLEKLELLKITNEERARLKILLLERSTDMHEDITNDQREKALLMIKVMEMVLVEAAEKNT
jgi:hypothetical protein